MNNRARTGKVHFCYNERTARVMLILCAVLAAIYILSFALHTDRPLRLASILLLLIPAIWASHFVWLIWLGRRHPVFSVSDERVEWREPASQKRSCLPTADIMGIERVTRNVVVFNSLSKGSVRIPFSGISLGDREELKRLLERRFGA